MKNQLQYISTKFYPNGLYYRFMRRATALNHMYKHSDLSTASINRIQRVLRGSLTKACTPYISPDYVSQSYAIVDRPYSDRKRGIYQNISGDLVIELSESDLANLREYLAENPDNYWHMESYLQDMFENKDLEYHGNLGESGYAMFSGPGILLRVYYPGGHESYNDSDDDKGTDWDKSKLWYFGRYAIEHPLEVLANNGRVVFTFAPNYDDIV